MEHIQHRLMIVTFVPAADFGTGFDHYTAFVSIRQS